MADVGAPGPDEVVIEIEAFPINPADLLTISGGYAVRPKLPATLGAEGVGRVGAVRVALGPMGKLRVDVNASWDLETAIRRIQRLDEFDLEYVEQPVATLAEMKALRSKVRVPIAADELVRAGRVREHGGPPGGEARGASDSREMCRGEERPAGCWKGLQLPNEDRSTVMHIVTTDHFQAIELVDLSTVNGGYDLGQAIQAGNTAAGPGREAGQTLGNGFDAAYQMIRGQQSTVGSRVGGPIGAAVGWTGGFVGSSVQQLWPRK